MALVVRNLQIDLTVRNGLTVFSMLLRIIFEAACDLTHMPHERAELNKHPAYQRRDAQMLAEKFFLLLEVLRSHTYPDGSPRVVSSSPHVPVKLPSAK
jgi:hypothetical protein